VASDVVLDVEGAHLDRPQPRVRPQFPPVEGVVSDPLEDGLAGVDLATGVGVDEEQLLLDPERERLPRAEARFMQDPVAVAVVARR
jgi:hypothetical protein